jgi:REP element-mobilizing transposase RayT
MVLGPREFVHGGFLYRAKGFRRCASERGSIENANGLVRHFLSEKTSFARLTQSELNWIQSLLNNSPRPVDSDKNPLPQQNSVVDGLMPKQLSFLPRSPREHGGTFRKGRRKSKRPFDPKRSLHLTMRSRRARGVMSMLRQNHKWRIWGLLQRVSEKHQIRVYRFANVGNHLHLLVQARRRDQLQRFLCEFTGGVANLITGATKGRPEKFWDGLVWSKLVDWGRQFQSTARYVLLNVLEGLAVRDRQLLARLESEGVAIVTDPGGSRL